MNVQIIHFVDIWLKRLCLKICNTARCNKELVAGLLRPRLFPFGKLSKAKSAAQQG